MGRDNKRELPVGVYRRELKSGSVRYVANVFYHARPIYVGMFPEVRQAVGRREMAISLLNRDEEEFFRMFPQKWTLKKGMVVKNGVPGVPVDMAKVRKALAERGI